MMLPIKEPIIFGAYIFGKVRFTPLNYRKSLIFLQLENWIIETIQLSKPDKFDL